MIYDNVLFKLDSPVRGELRDGKTTVVVHGDGNVYCEVEGLKPTLISKCDPESTVFPYFLYFWAVRFMENRLSMAFSNLVTEMLAGHVEQDQYCPFLFIDKLDSRKWGENQERVLGYRVREATEFGELPVHNPDDFYLNSCYALAENPRIKFYQVIKDFEGNDFPHGWTAGITTVAGHPPVFDGEMRSRDAAHIIKMGEILLEECPEPAARPVLDPDMELPF